jgi:hypothetical protein
MKGVLIAKVVHEGPNSINSWGDLAMVSLANCISILIQTTN